ncbi:MaoC/PaaZ C-terminal domain-containing protein, partial [Rhodopseudomonas sp. B29]|uniref:MaoC/PaaZ C-terminal domain-containing protein n=1 Tax=Rhodopseudomonas sp. B29 TaxID=95607 RepID=UPI0003B6935E
MDQIQNRTYDEIALGDTASLVRTLTAQDIAVFAIMSGDVNPMHVDAEYAKSDMFHQVIAHGMWGGALISTLLGTQLPGPGTIYLDQSLRFKKPVLLGDTITVTVKVTEKNDAKKRLLLDCRATNQHGDEVITGIAEVIAPTEKISRPRVIMPEIDLHRTAQRYERMIEMTRGMTPLRTAVVHP